MIPPSLTATLVKVKQSYQLHITSEVNKLLQQRVNVNVCVDSK